MATGDRAPLIGIVILVAGLCLVGVLSALSPPPLWVLTRDRLPTCPPLRVPLDQAPPETSDCLWASPADGAADAGAELVVTTLTTEGDPIRTYYRRLPGRSGLEVLTDSSDDRFGGGGGWTRQVCPDASSLTALGTCRDDA